MAEWKEVLDESFSFPNIDIFQKLKDGVLSFYEARSQEGYVFYDPNEEYYEQESPDSEPVRVIHYFVIRIFPATYNWANFSLIAVPRDSVDENYIFGSNNHEVV